MGVVATMRSGTRLFGSVLESRTQKQLNVLRTKIEYWADYLYRCRPLARGWCRRVRFFSGNEGADGQDRAQHRRPVGNFSGVFPAFLGYCDDRNDSVQDEPQQGAEEEVRPA